MWPFIPPEKLASPTALQAMDYLGFLGLILLLAVLFPLLLRRERLLAASILTAVVALGGIILVLERRFPPAPDETGMESTPLLHSALGVPFSTGQEEPDRMAGLMTPTLSGPDTADPSASVPSPQGEAEPGALESEASVVGEGDEEEWEEEPEIPVIVEEEKNQM